MWQLPYLSRPGDDELKSLMKHLYCLYISYHWMKAFKNKMKNIEEGKYFSVEKILKEHMLITVK